MVLKGPGARAGGWGETRAPSLIFPTPSVRGVSLCLGGRLLLQRFALLLSHPPFYACFSSERTSCTSLAYPWRDWFNFTANRCIHPVSHKYDSRKLRGLESVKERAKGPNNQPLCSLSIILTIAVLADTSLWGSQHSSESALHPCTWAAARAAAGR